MSPSRLLVPMGLLLVAAARVAATDFPEHEPNNTFPPTDIVGPMQSGDRITGNISSSTDVDYFYADTAGTGKFGLYRYCFVTQGIPSGGDSVLTIFDTETKLDEYGLPVGLLNYNDDAYPGVKWSRAYYDMWTNGQNVRWGILIEGFDTSDVWPYAIQVTWQPVQFIEGGQYNPGSITFDTLQSTGISDTVIALFDGTGKFVGYNDDDTADGTFLSKLTETLPAGDYYVSVSSYNTYVPHAAMDRTGVGPGDAETGSYVLTINGTQFAGTIQTGLADWYHVRVGQPSKTIAGTVSLQNYKGTLAGVPIPFEVRQTGTTNVLETATATLVADGSYSFDTHQTGTVDIATKPSVWLRGVLTVDLTGTTTNEHFALTGGDADGNNKVALPDLSTVLAHFGQSGAGVAGDLDGSQTVGLADLSLVLMNFNKSGAP